MRKSSLLSLSLLATTAVACANDDSGKLTPDATGTISQAITSDGSIIKLVPVKLTADMAARGNAPAAVLPAAPPGIGSSASVRTAMSSVKDQGGRGTCATFSSVGLSEAYVRGDLSEQCIVREIGGNDGAWPSSRLALLTTRGAVDEATCKYDAYDATVNIPSPYNYDTLARSSGTLALVEYAAWNEDPTGSDVVNRIKKSLAAGNPVIGNFIIPDNTKWFDYDAAQIIDVPSPITCGGTPFDAGASCAGHSVVIVGYDDATSTFTIKNSWGGDWKDGGYGRVRYAYFQKFAFGEFNGLKAKFEPLPPVHGDFNGDGRDDLIITTASGSYEYLGRADGGFDANAWVRNDLTLGNVNYVPGDFNGDGRSDVIIETRGGSYLYLGRSAGGFIENAWVRGDLKLGQQRYTTGDFNGDGRTDFVITNASGSYAYLGAAAGFVPNAWVRGDLVLGGVSYTPGDFNGDYKTDLMIATAGGSYLYTGRADGSFNPNVYVRTDLPLGKVQYTPGDFNGDSLSDLIITTASGSYEYQGKTDGTFVTNVWVRNDLTLGNVRYVAADTCGDGKTDLMITTASGSYLYRGAAAGFVANAYVRTDLPLGSAEYFPSDLNGDGRQDLVITTLSGTYVYDGKNDGTFVENVYVRNDLRLHQVAYF